MQEHCTLSLHTGHSHCSVQTQSPLFFPSQRCLPGHCSLVVLVGSAIGNPPPTISAIRAITVSASAANGAGCSKIRWRSIRSYSSSRVSQSVGSQLASAALRRFIVGDPACSPGPSALPAAPSLSPAADAEAAIRKAAALRTGGKAPTATVRSAPAVAATLATRTTSARRHSMCNVVL